MKKHQLIHYLIGEVESPTIINLVVRSEDKEYTSPVKNCRIVQVIETKLAEMINDEANVSDLQATVVAEAVRHLASSKELAISDIMLIATYINSCR